MNIIDVTMANTYTLRRKEIIENDPLITEEFTHLVSADLIRSFYGALDEHVPRFLELYRKNDPGIAKLHGLLHRVIRGPTLVSSSSNWARSSLKYRWNLSPSSRSSCTSL
ncbi:hypothetical protein AAFF_G00185680 [Aldrovandia affinis]|uniref:Uncharacterized protein n=1 Tax=Aldrovandia affinis TaxID=143900 RepID=A0AAD7RJW8_9TELE|nr:hypothetical protein AAFF_G00185680 [Aldrovandia affinis]